MPRVEDFPPVAQRQLRAQQAPAAGAEEERRPRGLLARLASGLTRRDDEDERAAPGHGRAARMTASRASLPPRAAQPHPAGTPASEFAKPPQPRRMGESRRRGRQSRPARPRRIPIEPGRDDQLEIPAFLRRQTS